MLYALSWEIPRRLNFICRRFGTFCLFHLHSQAGVIHTYPPMKMEKIERSETLEFKLQTPVNHPEEIQLVKNIKPKW
jgi:hypothetical protein